MDVEQAREIMTAGLVYSSRLGKVLSDVQHHLAHHENTRVFSNVVGEILGWFLFEVFGPLGHRFAEIRELPYEDKDWAPDWVPAANAKTAVAAIGAIAEEGDALESYLQSVGVVSPIALTEYRDLRLECRRYAERATIA